MRRSKLVVLTAGLLVALAGAGRAHAQRGPQDGRRGMPADRAQLEQRIRAQMGRLMRERLGLDDDQAAKLSAVVQDFDGRRRELLTQEEATRRRVDAVLLESGADQTEARQLVDRMGDLRIQEAQLFRSEQEALLDVLTPSQVLRLQQLRQDIGRRIRALGGPNPGPDGDRGTGRPGRPPGGRGTGSANQGAAPSGANP
jgi:Spy/CpxP family protein refolding chaperone